NSSDLRFQSMISYGTGILSIFSILGMAVCATPFPKSGAGAPGTFSRQPASTAAAKAAVKNNSILITIFLPLLRTLYVGFRVFRCLVRIPRNVFRQRYAEQLHRADDDEREFECEIFRHVCREHDEKHQSHRTPRIEPQLVVHDVGIL